MRENKLLQHASKMFMNYYSKKKWRCYKVDLIERKVFFLFLMLLLAVAISGCAGTGSLDVGGSKVDITKIDAYSSKIEEKVKKTSQNYEKNTLHKALVGESLISKIKGYVQKCKSLIKTSAGQYVTKKGKEYKIKYKDTGGNGYYIHVDCQGDYSNCGVGYYKIDSNGAILSTHPYYDYYGEWYVVNDLSIKKGSNQTVEKGTRIFEPLVSIRYSKNAYKTEIIYSGIDDDNLKLEYKKYTSYLTKPSLQQSQSYTLNKDNNIVTFKKYKIKVVEATNQHVKYIVLSD